jgi:hypothetical protein
MRINHKFLTVNPRQNPLNWDNRFYTKNVILENFEIYKPEIESIFDDNDNNHIDVKLDKEYILFNGIEYNPISDKDLQTLNSRKIRKVNWNTNNIIAYLQHNPQIRKIYFTRQSNLCWQDQINLIIQKCPEIDVISIYTPTAQGGALHKQTGIYENGKMIPLLRHWTKNNNGNYGNLNHNNWLTNNGVIINNF